MSARPHQYTCEELGVCQDRVACDDCPEFSVKRIPRTLQEAFGPGPHPLEDGQQRLHPADKIVVRTSGFAIVIMGVALLAACSFTPYVCDPTRLNCDNGTRTTYGGGASAPAKGPSESNNPGGLSGGGTAGPAGPSTGGPAGPSGPSAGGPSGPSGPSGPGKGDGAGPGKGDGKGHGAGPKGGGKGHGHHGGKGGHGNHGGKGK